MSNLSESKKNLVCSYYDMQLDELERIENRNSQKDIDIDRILYGVEFQLNLFDQEQKMAQEYIANTFLNMLIENKGLHNDKQEIKNFIKHPGFCVETMITNPTLNYEEIEHYDLISSLQDSIYITKRMSTIFMDKTIDDDIYDKKITRIKIMQNISVLKNIDGTYTVFITKLPVDLGKYQEQYNLLLAENNSDKVTYQDMLIKARLMIWEEAKKRIVPNNSKIITFDNHSDFSDYMLDSLKEDNKWLIYVLEPYDNRILKEQVTKEVNTLSNQYTRRRIR